MRNLMIIMPIVLAFCVVGNGQVKDQFRDRKNTSTIVVVKEDGATDQALLDEHFDLASMNMSDQIMIMTSTTPPDVEAPVETNTATASIDNDMEAYFENEGLEEVETEIEDSTASEVKVTEPQIIVNNTETTPIVVSRTNTAPSRAKKTYVKGTYAKKSSYSVKKAAAKKYFSKKKSKKNKRKKRSFSKKSSKGSCYNF